MVVTTSLITHEGHKPLFIRPWVVGFRVFKAPTFSEQVRSETKDLLRRNERLWPEAGLATEGSGLGPLRFNFELQGVY